MKLNCTWIDTVLRAVYGVILFNIIKLVDFAKFLVRNVISRHDIRLKHIKIKKLSLRQVISFFDNPQRIRQFYFSILFWWPLYQLLLTCHIPLGPDKVELPLVSERPPLCVDDDVFRLPMIAVPELYIFNILDIQRL